MLFILYFRLVRAYSFDDMCPFRGVFLRVNFLFCLYPWFPRYDPKLLSRIGCCIPL